MEENSKKRIYIAGASGFLGSRLAEYLRARGHEILTARIDIRDFPALRKEFLEQKPDVVINFAGAKAHPSVDWCEEHKEETVMLNVVGAINIATAALEAGAYPIQMTSGCVYLGGPEKVFSEEDAPNFDGNFYSRMKIVVQEALEELPVLQVRIRLPISAVPNPRNLLTKLLSFKKIISVPNSVTLVEDMLPALLQLALSSARPTGILNLTNEGYLEYGELLEAYKKHADPAHEYEIISPKELEGGITKSKRSNCVLDISKAKSLGLSMPPIDVEKLVKAYRANLA